MEIINDIQLIATGLNLTHQPPTGQDEIINRVGASVWTAVGAPNNTPRVNVGITDGVLGPAWVLRSGDTRGWFGQLALAINPLNYLVLENPAAGGNENLSFQGQKTREYGNGRSNVITDLQRLQAGITYDIRPPVDEDWVITNFGSTAWVGVAPAGIPNITVELTDGVSFAKILDPTDALGWAHGMKWYINNSVYLRVTNSFGGQADVAFVGQKLYEYGNGVSKVKSAVATVGIGASLNARPVGADEQWKVSGVGASVWVGVAPAELPDIDAFLNDGTLTSLLSQNSDYANIDHNGIMGYVVENGNYLTITDTSGAGGDVGYSAIMTRQG